MGIERIHCDASCDIVTLNPIKPITCDKKIAVENVLCERPSTQRKTPSLT